MIEYSKLKEKPREFLAVTSLTDEEFQALLPTFEKCYELLLPPKPKPSKKKKQRAGGGGRRSKLSSPSEKLLFILVYQKTSPLQVAHGLQFGLSQGQVNYWVHRRPAIGRTSAARNCDFAESIFALDRRRGRRRHYGRGSFRRVSRAA